MVSAIMNMERDDPGNVSPVSSPAVDKQLRGSSTITVNDAPKLDLDAYIGNYEGRTRLERLRTIGVCSKTLGADALHMAAVEASTGQDANLFRELRSLYKDAMPDGQAKDLDDVSANSIEAAAQREADKLENDLKGYKNNLIKESIRLGNDDLGQHYYRSGHLAEAFRAFSSMREHCTVPKHAAEMSLKLILTAVAQGSWINVSSNVMKLQNLNLRAEDKTKIDPLYAPLEGLCHLHDGQYKEAADSFLLTDPEYATVEAIAGVRASTQILTPNDVATYGGLCALATLSRQELARRVLENADFRSFLELESHLRRAIVYFCNSKYTECLEILDSYRADYMLDMHLQRHVETLFAMIRRKSIVAYCAPFSKVSIAAMGAAFGVSEGQMEEELLGLIKGGELKGRLDVVDMLLVSSEAEGREASHAQAMKMAEEGEQKLRLRLFRLNMLLHGFELKGSPRRETGGHERMGNGR